MSRIDLIGQRFGKLAVKECVGRNRWRKFIWLCQCDCGNLKKVNGNELRSGETKSCGCLRKENGGGKARFKKGECPDHRMEKHPQWKGGRSENDGYSLILNPHHPNAYKSGYVLEHVMVMANYLGRPLFPNETVHHKNGIRNDNRLENLELWTNRHPMGQRIDDLISYRIEMLERYAPEKLNQHSTSYEDRAGSLPG